VVLAAAPLALHVPLAALAGILLFVAWNMASGASSCARASST
jgi:MFS superfamily sulfate permease-like transporter